MGVLRAENIILMRQAIAEGKSATRFYWERRAIGVAGRKTVFLADYRELSSAKAKEGLLRYVRKDRYPSTTAMAILSPEASKEYMYKLKVKDRINPEAPLTERFVNLSSAMPLTPEQIEQEVLLRWSETEKYDLQLLEAISVWEGYRKEI